ncbi:hypothetical protein BVIET440_170048 [Burkholderia vietnamiensis]
MIASFCRSKSTSHFVNGKNGRTSTGGSYTTRALVQLPRRQHALRAESLSRHGARFLAFALGGRFLIPGAAAQLADESGFLDVSPEAAQRDLDWFVGLEDDGRHADPVLKACGGKLAESRHDGARYPVGLELGISGADRQCAHGSEHLQLGLMAQRGSGKPVLRDSVGRGNLVSLDQAEQFVDDHFALRIASRLSPAASTCIGGIGGTTRTAAARRDCHR